MTNGPAKFELGQVVATPQAIKFCAEHLIDIYGLMMRHASGDWGDLTDDDKLADDVALADGSRILSSYTYPDGKVWLLTEPKGDNGLRASTCLMLPSDY